MTKSDKNPPMTKTDFSGPCLRRSIPLGRKYSSNDYLARFQFAHQTNFRIPRTSSPKTRLATHSFEPRRAEFLHCSVITLRSKAALRVIWTQRRATAPDFENLRPPQTPKSGLSNQNPKIWRKPITHQNLWTRISLDPGFAWTRRLAENILQMII